MFTTERVRAAVRVRKRSIPVAADNSDEDPSEVVVSVKEGTTLPVVDIRARNGKGTMEFSVDAAFGEDSTQEDVYDYVEPLVAGVVQGINTTIFAYGQTGTGKSRWPASFFTLPFC
jgi:hypothetical protein